MRRGHTRSERGWLRLAALCLAVCAGRGAAAQPTSPTATATAPPPSSKEALDSFSRSPRLRTCCAFGHSLKTVAEGSTVDVVLDNVVFYDHLGVHSYAERQDETEAVGLVYTCRGGTIDIAHVRDYADWTAYLYHRIAPLLGTAASIRLPAEGAERQVLLRHASLEGLGAETRRELALSLAQRIAYDMSVWHEIATWYDHRSVPMVSERVSAFSIEDPYSNLLGTYIGADAVRAGGEHDVAVAAAIDRRLRALSPLPPYHTKTTLSAVDGLWWDSRKGAPDFDLVIRRNLDFEGDIHPWLVPDEVSPYCKPRKESPAPLAVPEKGPGDIALADLYELRFTVDLEDMRGFDLPPTDRPWVTQHDYPFIVAQIRRGVLAHFGPMSDRPEIDADLLNEHRRTGEIDARLPCGSADPDCATARQNALHGIHVGNMFVALGNYAGVFTGFTLADISTPAGGLGVLRYDSAIGGDNYMLHALAVETPEALFLCKKRAEDGSGEVAFAYPYINPFEPKCVPGSAWGLKVDLFELLYDSKTEVLGLRPFELGVGYNFFRNGHSASFLERRLVLTATVAPEFVIDRRGPTQGMFFGYLTLFSTHSFLGNRFGLRAVSQLGLGGPPFGVKAEASVRAFHTLLFSKRTPPARHPVHTSLRVGVELGVNYWPLLVGSLPSMTHKVYLLRDRDLLPDNNFGEYHAIVYLEASLPSLVVF